MFLVCGFLVGSSFLYFMFFITKFFYMYIFIELFLKLNNNIIK